MEQEFPTTDSMLFDGDGHTITVMPVEETIDPEDVGVSGVDEDNADGLCVDVPVVIRREAVSKEYTSYRLLVSGVVIGSVRKMQRLRHDNTQWLEWSYSTHKTAHDGSTGVTCAGLEDGICRVLRDAWSYAAGEAPQAGASTRPKFGEHTMKDFKARRVRRTI